MTAAIDRLRAALGDRYDIVRELGEGGMATVYLAHDHKHERKVALKVLKPELAAVVGAERFLAEIKTTANLQHPHILPLFDSGEADSFLFYVMPLVEGESLRERLDREKQLPVDEAVGIAIAVGQALDHAHRKGVIHRDIKPANVLLQEGQPVVADFGIALAVGAAGGTRLTETGLSVGTPFYMSPEQATGDQNVGPASDVYALGCVLFEMLVGAPPFVGPTAQAILGKIIAGAATPPAQVRPAVPRNVDACVRKALEKLPADRFTNARDFIQALGDEGFRHGEIPPEGVGGKLWNRMTGVAVVMALVAGLAIGVAFGGKGVPVGEVTRLDMYVPRGFRMSEATKLDISHDGRTLVYATEGGLHVRKLGDAFEGVPLPGAEDAWSPFFSPDDRWVGFSTNSSVRKVELASGTAVDVVSGGINYGATWDDVHGIVYTPALGQTGLWRVSADGGEPEQISVVDDAALEMAHAWPQALPDGRGILFTVLGPSGGWNDAKVAVIEWGQRDHRIILEGFTYARYLATGHMISVQASGAVMAQGFDLDRLEPYGSAVPVLDGVRVGSFGAGASLAVSETGTVALAGGSAFEERLLLELDRTGEMRRQFYQPLSGAWLSLSPDGSHLALTKRTPNNDDVWILDLNRGTDDRFTTAPDEDESPIWSPDGMSIAYSAAYTGLARRVFVRPADGSSEATELFRSDRHLHLDDWSPDGKWMLAAQFDPITELDLLVYPVDGASPPDTIANGPTQEGKSQFSSDGRWVVYTVESQETRREELWAIPFPALTNPRQITRAGGSWPRLSADDSEIFYIQDGALVVSDVSWVGGPRLTDPRQLFDFPSEWPSFEVSPDGESFFVLMPNPDVTREIRVILNWFEELKEKVPR